VNLHHSKNFFATNLSIFWHHLNHHLPMTGHVFSDDRSGEGGEVLPRGRAARGRVEVLWKLRPELLSMEFYGGVSGEFSHRNFLCDEGGAAVGPGQSIVVAARAVE
jgi:hypothetical protein